MMMFCKSGSNTEERFKYYDDVSWRSSWRISLHLPYGELNMDENNSIIQMMMPIFEASLEQLKTLDPNKVIQGEHGNFTVQEGIDALSEAIKMKESK